MKSQHGIPGFRFPFLLAWTLRNLAAKHQNMVLRRIIQIQECSLRTVIFLDSLINSNPDILHFYLPIPCGSIQCGLNCARQRGHTKWNHKGTVTGIQTLLVLFHSPVNSLGSISHYPRQGHHECEHKLPQYSQACSEGRYPLLTMRSCGFAREDACPLGQTQLKKWRHFSLFSPNYCLKVGQMSSLVSISFASDTVRTQEMGISVHTSQYLSRHNPFGLPIRSPPANDCITLSQTRMRLSCNTEITTPPKEGKKYNAWSSLWITWLKALEVHLNLGSGCPSVPKLCCAQHTPEPASGENSECGGTTTWAVAWPDPNGSSLWMRTHKSRVGWKPVLDNSSGLIHKECWRGGGELLKTGSYSNQLLSHSKHSHVHSLLHVFCPTQSYQTSKS